MYGIILKNKKVKKKIIITVPGYLRIIEKNTNV